MNHGPKMKRLAIQILILAAVVGVYWLLFPLFPWAIHIRWVR